MVFKHFIISYPVFLKYFDPRFDIFRLVATKLPDSFGGESIPQNAINAFELWNLLTSPISAMILGANLSPTPGIALITSYSFKLLASVLICVKIISTVTSIS